VKGGRFITHMRKLRGVETALANFLASGVLALGPKLGPVLWQLPANLPYERERMADFFASGVLALGRKLGPVLWQLPARMALSPDRLEAFLTLLPRTHAEAAALAARHDDKLADDRTLTECEVDLPLRHALEPRHPSFDTDEVRSLCAEHDIALVVADSAGRWPTMHDATSDFRYVRLHGETELYASGYTDESLDRWAAQCREWLTEGHDTFVYFDNDAKGHAPHDAVRLLDRLASDPGTRARPPLGPDAKKR
jgi:uncharacterized protein YecE (DUF72 family)